jgi:hypothetical protein
VLGAITSLVGERTQGAAVFQREAGAGQALAHEIPDTRVREGRPAAVRLAL